MILAGWLLAMLGLSQIVYAGTIDVTQVMEGNRLLGVAPSVIANADLMAQRGMLHQSGLACFLAGAIFLAAAYLKPAPEGVRAKSWTSTGALAAGGLAVAAAIGFGLLSYELRAADSGRKLADEGQLKRASAEAAVRMLGPAQSPATPSSAPPSGAVAGSSEPAD